MKKIILFPLFLICAYIGRSQVLEVGRNPLPCKCDVKIQFYDARTFSIANTPVKRNISKKEKKAEARYDDGIPCVDNFALRYVWVQIYLQNFSQTDIKHTDLFEDAGGFLSINIFKIRKDKLIPVAFGYPDVDYFNEVVVKQKEIDTITSPFFSKPHGQARRSKESKSAASDIDTGLYVYRGSYLQKCNGKVTRKYTNEVFFRLIE
jgi:hypothetical protein